MLFYANSVDPDQTPHSAASDLGPHCLPLHLVRDDRNYWVNERHAGFNCRHTGVVRNRKRYMYGIPDKRNNGKCPEL